MRHFEDDNDFYNYVRGQLSHVASEICSVQRNWEKEKGKVPFSSYVHVVQYYLRQTSLDMSVVSIKSKGKAILVHVAAPKNIDATEVQIVFSDRGTSARTSIWTTTTLSDADLLKKYLAEFPKNCKKYGLEQSDYGKEFTLKDGKSYKIVGCHSRKQTYGIVAQSLEDGKRTSVRTTSVLKALGKKHDSNS